MGKIPKADTLRAIQGRGGGREKSLPRGGGKIKNIMEGEERRFGVYFFKNLAKLEPRKRRKEEKIKKKQFEIGGGRAAAGGGES